MPKTRLLEKAIVDNLKFGPLEVINKTLRETIEAGTDPEEWSAADKGMHVLIS